MIQMIMTFLKVWLKWDMASTDHDTVLQVESNEALNAPTLNQKIPIATSSSQPNGGLKTPISAPTALLWDTPQQCFHSTRVLCDNAGLPLQKTEIVNGVAYFPKDIICSCIYQESNFYNYLPNRNPVKHENRNKNGSLSSTDWGICQINDYFHIGKGKDFPSVDYVLANPEKTVGFMIAMYKAGQLSQWSSYKSGANRQWLGINSPMWKLKV